MGFQEDPPLSPETQLPVKTAEEASPSLRAGAVIASRAFLSVDFNCYNEL
jgi:hypothetical protein